MSVQKDFAAVTSGLTAASFTWSRTVANNPGRALYVWVGVAAATPPTISGITFDGVALTSIAASGVFATNLRFECWRLLNPNAVTANIVATFSASADEIFMAGVSIFGVDQTTPNGTVNVHDAVVGQISWGSCAGFAGGLSLGCAFMIAGVGSVLSTVDGIPEQVIDGNYSSKGATGSTMTQSHPTGILPGDLLLIGASQQSNATITLTTGGTGWTALTQRNQGASFTARGFWKIADGTESGTVTLDFASNTAEAQSRMYVYRDTKAKGTPLALESLNSGNGTTVTFTGITTTDADSRAVGLEFSSVNTAFGAPTQSFVEDADTGNATSTQRTGLIGKDMAAAAATNSPTATCGSSDWVSMLYELYNSDAGAQTYEGEVENIGGVDVGGALVSEAGDSFNTFGVTFTTAIGGSRVIALGVKPSVSLPLAPNPMNALLVR